MQRHSIPTAAYATFDSTTLEEGLKFLETLKPPYVLKADGLAAGKGVLIVSDLNEAKHELKPDAWWNVWQCVRKSCHRRIFVGV